jgi:cell division protein FtsZ
VQGISDIITIPGIINRDFADVKAIMARMGYAVMGTATANGSRRAIEAAQKAIASPLLEAGAIDGARGILINITGSSSLKLAEVNAASTIIQSAAHEDANIIFGAVLDEKMKDEVKITVIATGFKSDFQARSQRGVTTAQHAIASARTANTYQVQQQPAAQPETRAVNGGSVHSGNGNGMPTRVMAAPVRETPSLATVTEAIRTSVDRDDLDVPAFIRMRGDINCPALRKLIAS